MELVDGDSESPTLISNLEVMQLLQKNIEERAKKEGKKKLKKRPNKQFRHRDWVEKEVHRYLQSTNCGKLDPDRKDEFYSKLQGNKKIRQKAAASSVATKQEESTSTNQDEGQQHDDTSAASVPTGFGLTEAEALQIMNTMPSEPVEIHLMIDELQSRMSDEQQEQFLEFIGSYCKDEETPDAASAAATAQEAEPMEENEALEEEKTSIRKNGTKGEGENGKMALAVGVKKEADSDSEEEAVFI